MGYRNFRDLVQRHIDTQKIIVRSKKMIDNVEQKNTSEIRL